MTSVIRMLINTFHNQTGAVRAGQVVEVPKELGDHWTNNNIAEDATGQKVTRRTAGENPVGQDGPNEYGQWPAPAPIDPEADYDTGPAPQSSGNFSSMIGRREAGLAPPLAPEPSTAPPAFTPVDPDTGAIGEPGIAEPTSGPMEPSVVVAQPIDQPHTDIPPGQTLDGSPAESEAV